MLFACALLQGLLERCLVRRSLFCCALAMNIDQLRCAVLSKEAVVKWLEAELEKEDRVLVELEKQLERAEERAQWT